MKQSASWMPPILSRQLAHMILEYVVNRDLRVEKRNWALKRDPLVNEHYQMVSYKMDGATLWT